MVSGVLQIQNNNASFGEFKEILLSLRSPRGAHASAVARIQSNFVFNSFSWACLAWSSIICSHFAMLVTRFKEVLLSLRSPGGLQASAVRCFHSVFALRARQSWTAMAWSVLMLLCVANAHDKVQGSSALASLARTAAPLKLELRFACSR